MAESRQKDPPHDDVLIADDSLIVAEEETSAEWVEGEGKEPPGSLSEPVPARDHAAPLSLPYESRWSDDIDIVMESPLGEPAESVEALDPARGISQESGDDPATGADDDARGSIQPPIGDSSRGMESGPAELQAAIKRAHEPLAIRLASALAQEIEHEGDPQRLALWHHERGHLQEGRRGEEAKAARSYAEALALDPTLRPNLRAIRQTLIAHERWEQLVKLYEAELRVERDSQRRAEILLERGWLLETLLGRPAEAAEAYWQAHEEARGGWLVPLFALERLAQNPERGELLLKVWRAIADCADDPERKAAALRELARIQERTGDGGLALALATLDQAAALSLDRLAVLAQMDVVTARRGLEAQRVAVLSALAHELAEGNEANPDEAAGCLLEAAWLARSQLRDPALAQQLLHRANQLCPAEPLPAAELQLLAETEQDTAFLVKLLEQRLSRSEATGEQTALLFRIALAHLRHGDHGAAAQALGRCLALTPGYLPALVELERAAMAAPDAQKLVDVWLAESEHLQTLEVNEQDRLAARVHVLWRLALGTYQLVGDVEQAMQWCAEALALDPSYQAAQRLRVSLLLRWARYEELAQLWDSGASASAEGRYLRQLVCSLALGPLQQPDRALDALQLLAEGGEDDRYLTERRAEMLLRVGDYAELDRALEQIEGAEPDEARRSELRLRRASIAEHELRLDDRAAELYRGVLGRKPANPHALVPLQALLRRRGDWRGLAEVLESAAGGSTSAAQRRSLLLDLGALYIGPLGMPARASEVYGELLQQHAADLYVLRHLEISARGAARGDVLVDALRRQVELLENPLTRARKRLYVAYIREQESADADDVLRAFGDAVELAGGEPLLRAQALWGQARQHLRAKRWSDARSAYASLLAETPAALHGWLYEEQAWLAAREHHAATADELWARARQAGQTPSISLLMRMLTAAENGDERGYAALAGELAQEIESPAFASALRLQGAALQRASQSEQEGIAAAMWSLVRSQPEAADVEVVLSLLAIRDTAPARLAELLQALGTQLSAKHHEQLPLLVARAYLEAGNPRGVVSVLKPLLAANPRHLPALLLLQRTAAAAGAGELEAALWLRIAALMRDADARGMAYGRAGALFEASARAEDAAKAYRRALAARPNDVELMARLEEAYRDVNDYGGLEELVSLRLRAAEDPESRASLLFQRAQIRRDRLNDPRGAVCDLLRVLEIEPGNQLALRDAAAIFDQHDDLERAYRYYGMLAEVASQPDVYRFTITRLADVLGRQNRIHEAAATCRHYLESYPQDEEVWEQLVELHLRTGERRRALEALRRLSDLPAAAGRRVARLRRLARFYWQELADPRLAREALLSALEVDATDLETLRALQQVCRELQLDYEFRQPVERAKQETRQAIGRAPLDAQLYERLLKLAEWSDDRHTLLGTLGALCCLNAANADEQQLYRRSMQRSIFDPQKQLSAHAWQDSLVTREARGALGEVWRVIAEAVPKLSWHTGRVATELAAFGVSKDDQVSRETGGAIQRVARVLNVPGYELYVTRSDPRLVAGIAAEVPQLIVGYTIVSTLQPADRFRIGRALYLLRENALALEVLSIAEIHRLLASAVYAVEPAALKESSTLQLEDSSRQLQRALSRKARRALPLAVNRLLQEGGRIDTEAWVNGVLMSASRAAFLVCGDIVVAMQELVPELGDPVQRSVADNAALLARYPFSAQLLPFSVSEQHLELRRELQI